MAEDLFGRDITARLGGSFRTETQGWTAARAKEIVSEIMGRLLHKTRRSGQAIEHRSRAGGREAFFGEIEYGAEISKSKFESQEQNSDAPILDTKNTAVKALIKKGKERGFVTHDELNAALPQGELT